MGGGGANICQLKIDYVVFSVTPETHWTLPPGVCTIKSINFGPFFGKEGQGKENCRKKNAYIFEFSSKQNAKS